MPRLQCTLLAASQLQAFQHAPLRQAGTVQHPARPGAAPSIRHRSNALRRGSAPSSRAFEPPQGVRACFRGRLPAHGSRVRRQGRGGGGGDEHPAGLPDRRRVQGGPPPGRGAGPRQACRSGAAGWWRGALLSPLRAACLASHLPALCWRGSPPPWSPCPQRQSASSGSSICRAGVCCSASRSSPPPAPPLTPPPDTRTHAQTHPAPHTPHRSRS
jgi:hypothetical protein